MLNVIFTSSITQMIVYPGLEEELAEAIDKDFYDSYKTWTLDNQKASSPTLDPPCRCFANVPPLLLFETAFRFDRTAALFAIS